MATKTEKRGRNVRDVPAPEFIKALAAHFKKTIKDLPAWVRIVKTGTHKELPPQEEDWFYTRIG